MTSISNVTLCSLVLQTVHATLQRGNEPISVSFTSVCALPLEHARYVFTRRGLYIHASGSRKDVLRCVFTLTLTFSFLADAFGCRIKINSNTAIGKPQYSNRQPRTIYSCVPGSSSTQYEVHVMSVYEGNRHTRPPSAGDTNVNIVSGGQSGRPIVLVFVSYEPVNWILHLPAGVKISKVILVSTRQTVKQSYFCGPERRGSI